VPEGVIIIPPPIIIPATSGQHEPLPGWFWIIPACSVVAVALFLVWLVWDERKWRRERRR
jgi:hypothetical protein